MNSFLLFSSELKIGTPRLFRMLATVVFPEPIPPVKPIFNGYFNNLWISSVPNWYRTPTRYLDSYDLFKHIYCNNKNECDFKNKI